MTPGVRVTALRLQKRWRSAAGILPIAKGLWRYSRAVSDCDPGQGWKIHVAATILSANDLLLRVAPLLLRHDALFKVPADLDLVANLNSGSGGYSQIGKVITVYPQSDADAVVLARELHRASRGFAGPQIPFDESYRRNSRVYYRYGAFAAHPDGTAARVRDGAGKSHPDVRGPGRAVPVWTHDPFNRQPRRRRTARGPIGRDYLVVRALAQRGKGGVFEAVDIAASPPRIVVIKQGRRDGDTDWSGDDGFSRIRRESQTLRLLHAAGIPVPRVLRRFTHGGNAYLVLEKLPGRALLPRNREQPASLSWKRALTLVERIAPILAKLHQAGWVWRDCKPSHIFVHRGAMRLIDFEGACRINQAGLLPWGSPQFIPPRYRRPLFTRKAGTGEDDYALGVIGFQFALGLFPPAHERDRARCYKRVRCPDAFQSRIERLLRS